MVEALTSASGQSGRNIDAAIYALHSCVRFLCVHVLWFYGWLAGWLVAVWTCLEARLIHPCIPECCCCCSLHPQVQPGALAAFLPL